MPPVDDNVWHHLGIRWDNAMGSMDILIDGTPRYIGDNIRKDNIIPSGGKFVIGQQYIASGFEPKLGFLGQLSGMNFWNTSFPGEMLESMAQLAVHLEGNILRWSNVLGNIFGDVQVVQPSNVVNTSKYFFNTHVVCVGK
jgi:CUB/sushi domain-containing protein